MPKVGQKTGNGHTTKSTERIFFNRRGLDSPTQELIHNALLSRSELVSQFLDPRRDINDECGYPDTGALTARRFKDLYDRESIATRVVEVLPRESWQIHPTVFETEDRTNLTEFESAFTRIAKDLRGDSWYESDESNPVWETLLQADILSGIGSFGVILLGLDDGKTLDEPAEFQPDSRLLFLRTFDQTLVDITRYEQDPSNPRFGQPITYNITFNDPSDDTDEISLPLTNRLVHWTRVIHVLDNVGSSHIFGVPRQRPVFNRLLDLRKLYAGSAEMYWRGAFPGLSIETNPNLGAEADLDKASIRTEMEQYMNGLQRYMALVGMSAKSLAPQVEDPTAQIDAQITAICIRLGIPKRIFMGSERGSLASSQDERTWNERLRHRQLTHITPRIIVPFIDRLIQLGILPEPEKYAVGWPDLNSLSEDEKATVAVKRTEAMARYIQGGVEPLMSPMDFMVSIVGFEPNKAKKIVETADKEFSGQFLGDINPTARRITEETSTGEIVPSEEDPDALVRERPM